MLLFRLSLIAVVMALSSTSAWATKKCDRCHAPSEKKFSENAHAIAKVKCAMCHGVAVKHQKDPDAKDYFSFKDTAKYKQINTKCMTCHGKNKEMLQRPINGAVKADASCVSCHKVHNL